MYRVENMFIKADNDIRNNDPAKQEVDWSKVGEELSIERQLSLYNVQFHTSIRGKSIRDKKFVNKFVYAFNREDAIKFITEKYENFAADINNIYCQKVDVQHGMTFSV